MSSFEHIYKEFYQPLLLYGLKYVENENDVHDIVQEVFAAVWQKEKYKFERKHLKSYLFNAVKNGCLNDLKHRAVVHKKLKKEQDLRIQELIFHQSVEKSLIETEDINRIHQAINSLSDNYKEIIQLSRFEGLKNKEISKQLDIPLRTVETRLFRALKKLLEILSKQQILILFQFSPINNLK